VISQLSSSLQFPLSHMISVCIWR